MFVCLLISVFVLIIVGHQREASLKFSLWSDMIWLRYLGSKNVYLFVLFVCFYICLFFALIIIEYPKVVFLKISWRPDLIWLRYLGSKMFIGLFVCSYMYLFFVLIITGSFPELFVKIWLDLAEILRSSKLDWHDGGGKEKEGRRGGILLCNGLIITLLTSYHLTFSS